METPSSGSREEWVRQFARHLQQLQPLLSDAQCMELASAAFASSNDLEADVAATVFSEILDASVPLNDLNRGLPRPDRGGQNTPR
jgi:hypothetical protein